MYLVSLLLWNYNNSFHHPTQLQQKGIIAVTVTHSPDETISGIQFS